MLGNTYSTLCHVNGVLDEARPIRDAGSSSVIIQGC
jgi:hypothetical protein